MSDVAEGFEVTVGAGTLRSPSSSVPTMQHRWTDEGVTVEAPFTGAHLLHLAAAGCVLNDVYREAEALGVVVDGVRVHARGGFDTGTWASTGIEYAVELDSPSGSDGVARLLDVVDRVAEIPRALRSGTRVGRVESLS